MRALPPLRLAIVVLVALLAAGCATAPKRPATRLTLPQGAPAAAEILADLSANDDPIQTLLARGAFTVNGPDFGGTASCAQTIFAYRRPADCVVDGRAMMGGRLLRLVLTGNRLYFSAPAQGLEQSYAADRAFPGTGHGRLSPKTLMDALFLPMPWKEASPGAAQVTRFDAASGTAVMEIASAGERTWRRVTVTGKPWRVQSFELIDGDKTLLIVLRDHYTGDALQFPTRITLEIPARRTQLKCVLESVELNGPLNPALFETGKR